MPVIDKTKEEEGRGYQILGIEKQEKKKLNIKEYLKKIINNKKYLRRIINNILQVVLIIFVAMVIIFFKIRQPSPEIKCLSKYQKTNIETAIELGRLYAYSLLEGYPYLLNGDENECQLLWLSTGKAENKMIYRINNNLDFFEFSENEKEAIYGKSLMLKNKHSRLRDISILIDIDYSNDFSDPIFSQLSDMKLVKINRNEYIVEMDFVYSKGDYQPVFISEKEPMFFHIVANYTDNGYWMVSDYDYKYNINDYLRGVLKDFNDKN